jgi:phytanoyl-CoA hydroxylase
MISQTSYHTAAKGFQQDGFFVIENFISKEEVAELHAELLRVRNEVVPGMPASEVYYDQKEDENSLKQLQQLHLHDAYFKALMNDSPFKKIAEHLLGEPVEGKNLQYFNKRPAVSRPTPPHQDGHYFMIEPMQAITLWLALDPVDEENGCVRYLRHSHRHGLRPHARTGTLGFSQGIVDYGTESDLANELPFCCTPGTLIGHHALTVHRADQNTSQDRDRRALGFIYYGASARVDEVAHARYQANLTHELQAENLI